MTVQEFFKSLNKDAFIRFYCKYAHISDENGQLYQYFTELCNYKELKPNFNKSIVWAVAELGAQMLHSFLIEEKDLHKKSTKIKNTYAYEFCDVGQVLNFDISQACIYKYGDVEYASAILYELTFFGYSLYAVNQAIEEKNSELNEMVQGIQSTKVDSIDLETFCNRLGWKDCRSKIELDFDYNFCLLEGKIYNYQMKYLIDLERHYRGINI